MRGSYRYINKISPECYPPHNKGRVYRNPFYSRSVACLINLCQQRSFFLRSDIHYLGKLLNIPNKFGSLGSCSFWAIITAISCLNILRISLCMYMLFFFLQTVYNECSSKIYSQSWYINIQQIVQQPHVLKFCSAIFTYPTIPIRIEWHQYRLILIGGDPYLTFHVRTSLNDTFI